jgi:hypothetical protein
MTPAESENFRRIRRLQVAANLRARIEKLPKPKEGYVSSTRLCYAYLSEEFKLAALDQEKKHVFWNVFPDEQGEQDFYPWAETVYQKLSAEIHGHELVENSSSLVRVEAQVLPKGMPLYVPCNGSFSLVKGDFPEVDHARYQALSNLLDQRGREGIFQADASCQSEEVRTLVATLEDMSRVEEWSGFRTRKRAAGAMVFVPGKRARR